MSHDAHWRGIMSVERLFIMKLFVLCHQTKEIILKEFKINYFKMRSFHSF